MCCATETCRRLLPASRSSGGSGRQADPGSYKRASLGSATLCLPSGRVRVECEATFLRSSSHCRFNCRNWSCGHSSHFPLTRPLRGNPGPQAAGSSQCVLRAGLPCAPPPPTRQLMAGPPGWSQETDHRSCPWSLCKEPSGLTFSSIFKVSHYTTYAFSPEFPKRNIISFSLHT